MNLSLLAEEGSDGRQFWENHHGSIEFAVAHKVNCVGSV